MKLVDEVTGLMECTQCGSQHHANLLSGGRYPAKAWRCVNNCTDVTLGETLIDDGIFQEMSVESIQEANKALGKLDLEQGPNVYEAVCEEREALDFGALLQEHMARGVSARALYSAMLYATENLAEALAFDGDEGGLTMMYGDEAENYRVYPKARL
jgi:hypothetical protein